MFSSSVIMARPPHVFSDKHRYRARAGWGTIPPLYLPCKFSTINIVSVYMENWFITNYIINIYISIAATCSLCVCSILINCKASIITYKYTCLYRTFQKIPRDTAQFFVSSRNFARNRDRGPMTTDADGSHFDARAQFRGFFAATWNAVANGSQRGPRMREGAYYGSLGRRTNSSRRTRGLREGVPPRAFPKFRLQRATREERRRERTVIVPRLIFDIGSFELPS